MNSIINSLPEEDKPPITIVLNDPISKNRAKLFVDQYGEDADILEVTPNSKISAIAIALIWHKPDSFIWLEDDFILPNTTKQHYPFWPKLFNEKLKFFDLCGWGVSVDNYPHFDIPKNSSKFHINNNTKFMSGQKWLYNEPFDSFILMAQGLAMKTSFYYEVSQKHNHAGLDSIFISNSKRGICSPTLLGYHIGWNQAQDGYGHLLSHAWGDFGWNDTYLVRNVATGEERTICPKRDIEEIKEC